MKLIETQSIWDFLQKTDLPILLYGMGKGAEKILFELQKRNIPIRGIFASDEFVRGHSFHDFKVLNYQSAKERFPSMLVLTAFGTHRADVIERIMQLSQEQHLLIPDVPVYGDGVFDLSFFKQHQAEFEFIYSNLADLHSKRLFKDILNYKLSGKPEYLFSRAITPADLYNTLLQPKQNEVYLDAGAYNGDTVLEFIRYATYYDEIYAVEPDKKNFKKLEKHTEDFANIKLINVALGKTKGLAGFDQNAGRNSSITTESPHNTTVSTVDEILAHTKPTFIKYDVEGQEQQALLGSKNTLQKHIPKLFVSAYHRNEDLFLLPKLVLELQPAYKIYLRRYPSIPAWDLNYVFLP